MKEAPKLVVAPRTGLEKQQRAPATTIEPRTRKGLGKGSPGCKRKQKVTKRQDRTRSSEEFKGRKRSLPDPAQTSATATAPPPPKIAPKTAQQSLSPQLRPSTSTSTSTITRPPPPVQQQHDEPRQALRAQTDKINAGLKRVQLIRKVCAGNKDEPVNDRELESFWDAMDRWITLDARLVTALQGIWNDLVQDKKTSPIDKIVRLTQVPNGVVNCVQHFVGNLVREHIKEKNMSADNKMTLTAGCDALEQELQEMNYAQYVQVLKKCACQTCNSVLEFDMNYTRYQNLVVLYIRV